MAELTPEIVGLADAARLLAAATFQIPHRLRDTKDIDYEIRQFEDHLERFRGLLEQEIR